MVCQTGVSRSAKKCIPLFREFPHKSAAILARVFCAAVKGIEGYSVEMEVNDGWGDTLIPIIVNKSSGRPRSEYHD
jgi:hypothetical protein